MAEVFAHITGVTQEMMDEAQAVIGQELLIEQFNHEASYDTIRHYAYGLGDDNPLWCDEEYSARGPYGTMVAPPTFFYSVFPTGIAPCFAGLQPIHGGGEWTWYRYARRGERIKAVARLVDLEEHKGKMAERIVVEVGEAEYTTAAGELLATVRSRTMRTPRRGAEGALHYEPRPQRSYTAEEMENIERDVFAEERRGAEPRFWEDVREGDELVPVVKGPVDRITMTVYYAGAMGTAGYKACELRWKQWRNANSRPHLVPNNYDITYFAEQVLPSLGHQDDNVARAVGMPAAYDNGHQRIGWMAHVVTNWMGDAGFMRHLNVKVRRPNVFGNTTWCRGKVVGKRIEGTAKLADLELWAVTQDGELNTQGSAVVVLPSREGKALGS